MALTVLVAGATGRFRPVAEMLLDRGHGVRAGTRDPRSPAAQELDTLGAELVQFDFDDPVSIEGNGIFVDGELAGGIGLDIDTLSNSGEIGYWLAKRFEGRGIVTRACERFFDMGFDELGLHRMELQAASGNVRSRAVAGRLGMYEEGVARDGIRVADGYLDSVEYGILEDEWRARRLRA